MPKGKPSQAHLDAKKNHMMPEQPKKKTPEQRKKELDDLQGKANEQYSDENLSSVL
jgi:hypothetical protein